MNENNLIRLRKEVFSIHTQIMNLASTPGIKEIILRDEALSMAHLSAFIEVGRFLNEVKVAGSKSE